MSFVTNDNMTDEDHEDLIEIEDAHIVRDEGTIIVFEGIALFEDEEPQVVWFGVDHSVAHLAAEAAEEGMAVGVEPWQILGRTETV